jgi:hypothetical protein
MFEIIKYLFIHSFLCLYACEVTPGMGATRRSATVWPEGAPGGSSRDDGWRHGLVMRLNLCCNIPS